MRRLVVPHREQCVEPAALGVGAEVGPDGEDAVIEPIGRSDHPELAGIQRPVMCPGVPVQIEHRAGSRLAALQAMERVELAAKMVAVLADEHVEASDLHIAPGLEPLLPEKSEWNERRLRRVERADGEDAAPKIGNAVDRPVPSSDDV
jgi:hypothetical protein